MNQIEAADHAVEGERLAAELGRLLLARRWHCATAESCTGGWIAQVLTSVPGSSGWFDRGFVTYSNQAKTELLGVSTDTLARSGAVSREVAAQMVTGAIARSAAGAAVAVTGVAGPEGGSEEKPVGTVIFGWGIAGTPVTTESMHFSGTRSEIRWQAVRHGITGLIKSVRSVGG